MRPQCIAKPEQLKQLTETLQNYCREAHIEPGTPEYGSAGRLIMSLYESGISSRQELEHAMRFNSILTH